MLSEYFFCGGGTSPVDGSDGKFPAFRSALGEKDNGGGLILIDTWGEQTRRRGHASIPTFYVIFSDMSEKMPPDGDGPEMPRKNALKCL